MREKRVMGGRVAIQLALIAMLFPTVSMADDVPDPFTDIPSSIQPKKKPTAAAGPGSDAGSAGPARPYLAPVAGPPATSGPEAGYGAGAGAGATGGSQGLPEQSGPRDTAFGRSPASVPAADLAGEPDPYKALPPPDERSRAVVREELAPVIANDGSGLPLELWRGLDLKTVGTLISRLEIPPRSPALHALWQRLVTANVTAPGGDKSEAFTALQVEALVSSGLLREAEARLAKEPNAAASPDLAPAYARVEIALGHREQGCAAAKTVAGLRDKLPKPMKVEALGMLGYCAALATNPAAAGLAADLARDEGLGDSASVALLDAVANGHKPQLTDSKPLSVIDYRLIELTKTPLPASVLDHAKPATLALIAGDTGADPATRLGAAEAAARLNALMPAGLAEIYRTEGGNETANAPASEASGGRQRGGEALHRAGLFKAAEAERTPLKKTRLVRAFLDDCRRAGLYLQALEMSAHAVEQIAPAPEIGWFAETATEVLLAAGKYEAARAWARFGGGLDRPGYTAATSATGANAGAFGHWLALADIADPGLPKVERGAQLAAVEELALRGRFAPEQLHRLATVLDALDYNVPVKLWEAASRTPQPTGGHLPPTGVLSELQDASKKKEFGRTVLLAMDTLGPNGAEGAHMIALGDAIRALRRAGLDEDARRLGLEALFATWPRTATN